MFFVTVILNFCHLILFRISIFEFRISNAFRRPVRFINTYIFLAVALLIAVNPALADDVGITKARLIQKSEKSYVVEADATQVLVWAIKAPIFPDRFQVSELEFVTQSGWIVVRATATTTGKPLSAHDEILLPWMRNGAVITVQWLDGSVYQGLFLRSLEGIRVPLQLLMPSAQTLGEVCRDHFTNGLKHFRFKWIHLLLVLAVTLLLPSRQVFKGLLHYTFGQAFSLVLADVGLPGFDLIFTDILGIILIFLLAHAAIRQQSINQYLFLISLFSLLHGLSYAQELSSPGLGWKYKLPALFMFNFAIDACQYLTAIIILLITKTLGEETYWKKAVSYTTGAFSVALLMLLFQEHVITGKTDVPSTNSARLATRFSLPVSQQPQPGGAAAKRGTTINLSGNELSVCNAV